jgi:hypothetical protein
VDDAEQDRREFWEQLTAMTERMKRKWTNITLLLGIDANARVGSVRSQYIGTARPDRENANGTSFRHFLEATHIYAYNTYVDAGRTWVSPKGGKEARIDYVGSSKPPLIAQNQPRVISGIELATSGREDHRVVASDVTIMFMPPSHPASGSRFAIDLGNVGDPARARIFQDKMWAYMPPPHVVNDVDKHLEDFLQHVRSAAQFAFGRKRKCARQPWISHRTWGLLQYVAPLRRGLHTLREKSGSAILKYSFVVWASCTTLDFVPGADVFQTSREQCGRGWIALTAIPHVRWWLAATRRLLAGALHTLGLIHVAMKHFIWDDKADFLWRMASRAATAAEYQDSRAAYKIVRLLSGFQPRRFKTVRMRDGTISSSASQYAERWEDHFTELLQGAILNNPTSTVTAPAQPLQPIGFRPSVTRVEKKIQQLGDGKATGPDDIPSELMKAGGAAFAARLHAIIDFYDMVGFVLEAHPKLKI